MAGKRKGKRVPRSRRHKTTAGELRKAKERGEFLPNRNQKHLLQCALQEPGKTLRQVELAEMAGFAENTVWRWFQDPGFRTWWHQSIVAACHEMGGPMLLALVDIVRDPETAAQTKAKAAAEFLKITGTAAPTTPQSHSIVAFIKEMSVSLEAGELGAERIRNLHQGEVRVVNAGSDNASSVKGTVPEGEIPHYFAAVEATPPGAEAAARSALRHIEEETRRDHVREGGDPDHPLHRVEILSPEEVEKARAAVRGGGSKITEDASERESTPRAIPFETPAPCRHETYRAGCSSCDAHARATARPLKIPEPDGPDEPDPAGPAEPSWVDLVEE